jgi:hypothetical protein
MACAGHPLAQSIKRSLRGNRYHPIAVAVFDGLVDQPFQSGSGAVEAVVLVASTSRKARR